MSNTNDNAVLNLFQVVNKQKEEVKLAEKAYKRWNTNCSFKLFGSSPVNIQTANEQTIVKALAELLTFSQNIEKAYELLGVTVDNRHDGYSVDEWIEDFKKRIATIHFQKKKEKLQELEKRLNGILSTEQRREMELKAIMADLDV